MCFCLGESSALKPRRGDAAARAHAHAKRGGAQAAGRRGLRGATGFSLTVPILSQV